MPITYPLNLPTGVVPSRFEIKKLDSIFSSQSDFSFQEKFIQMSGQMWIFGMTFPPLAEAKAREMAAFISKLKGRYGTFLMGDPLRTSPRGTPLGAPVTATGALAAGSETLTTGGWTPASTNLLLPGDYFQLGSGETTRLYEVLNAVDSDGGGLATIDIWPSLRETYSISESLILANPKGTFRFESNARSMGMDTTLLYGFGFTATEAI